MEFKKNMNVVYGNSGVCVIEDIRPVKISAYTEEKTYYILRQLAGGTTIMVPADNEKLTSRMKRVLTKKQINELLDEVKNKSVDWIEDRHERGEYFRRVMTECNHEDMLLLISCIYLRKKELEENKKKLSMTDEKVLHTAVKLVEEEFSVALGVDVSAVGGYITNRLGIK